MSRYIVPAKDQSHDVDVGWDPPLDTFFGVVCIDERLIEADEDHVLFWVGTGFREIRTVDELVALMAPYAAIPLEVISRLRADGEERRYGPVPQRVAPLG